ncbi:MAG: transposase [Candidatus Saccharicenans sp.]|nr:MAG: transposase [Candidatus Aminicenantes bacterium]
MPRIARLVIPGLPHHIIQRGNRRQIVFFGDEDKALYLKILRFQASQAKLKIWGYCLMDNHVHLIAVPETADGLAKAISELHRKYTWHINVRNNWRGHLWQGRFISYPMDETYLYSCARYIERNPVRAGLVSKAEDYPWSSARAHIFGIKDPVLSSIPLARQIGDWRAYLRQQERDEDIEAFRKNQGNGLPLGSEEFINRLENLTGICLRPRPRGRPPK